MKKWIFRLAVNDLVLLGFLFVIVLSPMLTYTHKTGHLQFTVYHQQLPESRITGRPANAPG